MRVLDCDSLKRVARLEIGDDCFTKVNRVVVDGLNELESVIIGENNFHLDGNTGIGSKCVIMNCDQLKEIRIGIKTFYWYETFELMNLPSLISIQLDDNAFRLCHSIVFESMND